MSHTIDFATSNVALTFKLSATGSVTGTFDATLIQLSPNIGILSYKGSTGYNDAGTGNRQIWCDYDAGFKSLLGASVNSFYSGNVDAYQTFTNATSTSIDNYVYKSHSALQTRMIQFVIIGNFRN